MVVGKLEKSINERPRWPLAKTCFIASGFPAGQVPSGRIYAHIIYGIRSDYDASHRVDRDFLSPRTHIPADSGVQYKGMAN